MSNHKPKRGAPAIDMTAMVDVAFLLLTFFILTTTTFREDSSITVDAPTSVSTIDPGKTHLFTVLVSDSGRVFIGISDVGTREKMLANAIQNKKIVGLSEKGAHLFTTTENFGLPFAAFPKYLDQMTDEQRKKIKQPGISPYETDTVAHTGNELKEWVHYATYADKEIKFTIKGDKNANCAAIKGVMETFKEAEISHFGLITNLEGSTIKEDEKK